MSSSDSETEESSAAAAAAQSIRLRVPDAAASAHPVLCSFPGGLPGALQRGDTRNLPTFVYSQTTVDEPTTLRGEDAACYYAAALAPEDRRKLSVRYCVGVYDRRARTLTLSEAAAGGAVLALSQSVRNYRALAPSVAPATGPLAAAMAHDFTSAKKQKVLRSQAANRVTADSVVGAGRLLMNGVRQTMSESNQRAMEEAAAAAQEDSQQSVAILAATDTWRQDFLPPHDTTTNEAHRVYRARNLVSKETWKQVGRVVEACLRKDDVARAILEGRNTDDVDMPLDPLHPRERKWLQCVEQLVKHLCNASDGEPLDKERLQCAILLNHFARLYTSLGSRRKIQPPSADRSQFFGTPLEFGHFFIEKFCTSTLDPDGGEAYVMSKVDKDRCLLYMLIFFVVADSGKAMRTTNLTQLLDDIKQDNAMATQLLRSAGFTVERKAGTKTTMVSLKAPLTFPSAVRKRALKGTGRR